MKQKFKEDGPILSQYKKPARVAKEEKSKEDEERRKRVEKEQKKK